MKCQVVKKIPDVRKSKGKGFEVGNKPGELDEQSRKTSVATTE